jgi:predicted acetyltransferase
VCDDDNVASVRVIERCGGILESVVTPEEGARPIRRYWIG